MTERARIKHYRPSALDRQGFGDCVRELRGKVWSLRMIAKSLRRVYCECGARVAVEM